MGSQSKYLLSLEEDAKESACNMGDLGSIPGLRRSPGEGKGYPLQYSDLENSVDSIVDGVTKSRTRLRDFHFHFSLRRRRDTGTFLLSVHAHRGKDMRTQQGATNCRPRGDVLPKTEPGTLVLDVQPPEL